MIAVFQIGPKISIGAIIAFPKSQINPFSGFTAPPALLRSGPALFMPRFRPPVLIDEIQSAPGLLPSIKMAVDQDRKPGMFWLTGSQPFQWMKGGSESLAGRVGIINLLGFSRQEILGQGGKSKPFLPLVKEVQKRVKQRTPTTRKELFKLIWRGPFPANAISEDLDRDLFYGSYVQTYLQRDVRDLARVGAEMSFLRFLRAVAARTGQFLNLSGANPEPTRRGGKEAPSGATRPTRGQQKQHY